MKLLMTAIAILILWLSFAYPQTGIRVTSASLKTEYNQTFDTKYTIPSKYDSLVIAEVSHALANGLWVTASVLLNSLPAYNIVYGKDYVAMLETGSNGWCAFVVNLKPQKNIAILVPHDRSDLYTANEGIDMFFLTGAKYLLLNGSKRNAADSADCSHSRSNPYHWITKELAQDPDSITFISLHGNNDKDCGDVFITNGSKSFESLDVQLIKSYLDQEGFKLGNCYLYGTTNVNGRLVSAERFIHVEQSLEFRKSNYFFLIDAINHYFGDFYEKQ